VSNFTFKAQKIDSNEQKIIECLPNKIQPIPELTERDKKNALVEICNHIIDNNIDGDLVDLGCSGCFNSLVWGREIRDSKIKKKVYGFDNFRGYTEYDLEECERKFHPDIVKDLRSSKNRWKLYAPSVYKSIKKLRLTDQIEIVEGDIQETTKNFKPQSGSISLLYIDCNAYGASIAAINNLKKYFSDGALVFSDSGFPHPDPFLDGEKEAILEYSASENVPMFRTFFGNFSSIFAEVKNDTIS
tara:strand:- start:1363 stop:2094 length:732 start_codon:yes stop_codon:yes gene_type:complete